MATIKLKFRPSSVPETEGTLYYQVIHKRKVKWISTGYHVYPCEWDEKAGEVLIPPNSERKAELEKMQNQINWELKQWDSIIVEMGNQHKNVTINELCDAFNRTKNQKTVAMVWHINTINMLYGQMFQSSFTSFEDFLYGDAKRDTFVFGYEYLLENNSDENR